ncbi:MAG: glycosyl hydrolase family 32 [Lentisphaerae bacterium]|jgi:hypothetical protein|nr:glycosyl hydrolase family 32 [Lentisphaerota bacterium]MBT7054794.1 glycosyl hydrolase family 32 [Lentisphaerota bacterium]MBT7840903.1 glycosyl hydrolase family 32 [Lentisphaerota bacterium]
MIPATAATVHAGELLHNGIALPDEWPPLVRELKRTPGPPPPYLATPPAVIPIDVGRQLFVDDFLIESTTLKRTHHLPTYHPASPVLKPETASDGIGLQTRRVGAGVFSDGVWYDPADKLFKAWYWGAAMQSDRLGYNTCYATSHDGVQWVKPTLDVVPGTNIVMQDKPGIYRNSSTVWLDLDEQDPKRRFKMFKVVIEKRGAEQNATGRLHKWLQLHTSPDGIHWTLLGNGDHCGDRTTVFYNAFRKVWVFGLRDGSKEVSRCRGYYEHADALRGLNWDGKPTGLWVGADERDPAREDITLRRVPERPWDLVPSQLYNLDCVAYESVLLGMFSIWRGHPLAGATGNRPKVNEVCVGFSRDGFHWSRPDRRAFCPVSERPEDWNWGNVQSAGGCCLVVGDKLYVYVTAANRKHRATGMDATYTGLAVLRRDGFSSMGAGNAPGTLTTRPVVFRGRYCFVNADVAEGELRVEVLGVDGTVLQPFSAANCTPISSGSTIQAVTWRDSPDLSALSGKPVRFRFRLRGGQLYAFWVSAQTSGASGGYVAAGGPGFIGATDTVGAAGYPATNR